MRRAAHGVVVLVALSACPPPAQLEGSLCDSAGECPSGLVCFHDRCRAEACDPEELGTPCSAGVGACARPGVFECVEGQQRCSGVPGDPDPELCNGLDEDCDGTPDDSPLDAGEACIGGLGVCLAAGARVCVDGGWACETLGPTPVAEACNGLDDDCDGYVDDGCISTLAGSGPPGDRDGPWADALLHRPAFAASDGRGNVFFADSSNNKVKVVRPDGGVFTVAGNGACALVDGPAAAASFCQPWGVAVAANGDLYVTDIRNRRVRVVRAPLSPGAVVETRFADAGLTLSSPRGIHFTADGGLLVTDLGASKVYVLSNRLVATLGGAAGLLEGGAGTVQLSAPVDAVEDDDGSIIISESGSHRIRRVPRDGATLSSVIAGGGDAGSRGAIADRVGVDARFDTPQQLYLDADAGRVLVLDSANGAVRAVPLDGLTSTRTLARLSAPLGPQAPAGIQGASGPTGLARLDDETFAVTEVSSHWVRRVAMFTDGGFTVSGLVSGSATEPHRDDPDALKARLVSPDRLVSWPPHGLVWADATTVRLMILDAGRVQTLAGPMLPGSDGGRDGPLFGGAYIGRPFDVKPGPEGALYIADVDSDTVRRIDAQLQRLETFAGPGARVDTSFVNPSTLAFARAPDGEDLMFVVDGVGSNPVLRRFGLASGSRAVLAGGDSGVSLDNAGALTAGVGGDVYLADADAFLRRFSLDGGVAQVYRLGNNNGVRGFVFDDTGRLVWARSRRVLRGEPRDGGLEVLFESALYPDLQSIPGFADGPPRDAGILWNGSSVVLDGERLYVTDDFNHRLRMVLMPH